MSLKSLTFPHGLMRPFLTCCSADVDHMPILACELTCALAIVMAGFTKPVGKVRRICAVYAIAQVLLLGCWISRDRVRTAFSCRESHPCFLTLAFLTSLALFAFSFAKLF